jgi:glycosyltransferase involved in cell wall biosynthesis
MKITVICTGAPRTDDGSVRAYRTIEWLSGRHDVQLVTVLTGSGLDEVSEELGRMLGVIVGPTLRPPAPSWLGWRLWPGMAVRRSEELSAQLAEVTRGSDWVWLAWWQGAASVEWRPLQDSGGKVTWDFDSMSLWHWTAARAALRTNPIRAAQRLVSGATFRRFESKYLNDLDALIVPSARDQRWLADRLSRPVVHVRNVADLEALSPVRAVTPSSMGLTVVFVGSLYEPNILGLRWFLHRVWPRVVAQVPQSRFLIVGRGIESGLFRRLPRGVRVVGSVPDVRPYLQEARVVVCPVFFGGGIPNKVLESAAGGRPTVVSPYVARTLGDTAGFAVADHPARWAEALVKYLSDPSAADADGLIAYRNVQANYSLSRWHDDMLRLEALVLA